MQLMPITARPSGQGYVIARDGGTVPNAEIWIRFSLEARMRAVQGRYGAFDEGAGSINVTKHAADDLLPDSVWSSFLAILDWIGGWGKPGYVRVVIVRGGRQSEVSSPQAIQFPPKFRVPSIKSILPEAVVNGGFKIRREDTGPVPSGQRLFLCIGLFGRGTNVLDVTGRPSDDLIDQDGL